MPLIKLVTRRFPPLQAYTFIVGHRDYVDYGYTYTASLPEGKEGNSIWLREDEHFDHAKRLGQDAASDSAFVPNLIQDCYDRAAGLIEISEKISKSDLSNKSNHELEKIFSEYVGAYLRLARHLFTPHYVEISFSRTIGEWLHRRLKPEKSETDVTAHYNAIAVATKETNAAAQEQSLLTIADSILNDKAASELFGREPTEVSARLQTISPRIEESINEVLQKYGWVPMVNMANPQMNKVMVIASLHRILQDPTRPSEKLRQLKDNASKQKTTMENAINELAPPSDVLAKIGALQEFIYLRTYRMEIYGKSHLLITPLLDEIAKRAGIPTPKLKYMTHEEVLDFLRSGKRPAEGELDERMNAYAILMEDRKIRILSGSAAEDAKKQQLERESLGRFSAEVKGMPASRGIAVGPIRIVKSPEDIPKIQRGDILVTIMTTTDFTPVMSKVAAIVTDEGGATSHAAIVSRELGIPCIVGTRTATKVLHDGEFVRVDAENGIVYRLESS